MSDRSLFASVQNPMSYNRPPSLILSPTSNELSSEPASDQIWRLSAVGRLDPSQLDPPLQGTLISAHSSSIHLLSQAVPAILAPQPPVSPAGTIKVSTLCTHAARPQRPRLRWIKSKSSPPLASSPDFTHPCRQILSLEVSHPSAPIRSAAEFLSLIFAACRIFPRRANPHPQFRL